MNELSNKNIFKNILPFLAIFVVTLSYAGFQYVQDIAGGASASDNYDIEMKAVDTPLDTTKEWNWNVAIFSKNSNSSSQLKYKILWCNETSHHFGPLVDSLCQNIEKIEFYNELTSGTLSSDAKEVIHNIKHQSIACGSLEVKILDVEEIVKSHIIDTGIPCTKKNSFFGLFGKEDPSKSTNISVFDNMYCNFYKCDGEPEDEENPGEQQQPKTEPEQPGIPSPSSSEPASGEASYAAELANYIINSCSGSRVDGKNSLCMSKLSIREPYNDMARTKIMNSANAFHAYGGLQCVGFVKGAIAIQQGYNSNHSGNASSYAKNRPPYTFYSVKSGALPQANDLAVWSYTGVTCEGGVDCGHIAYVVRVEGNRFFVAEANRGKNCRGCVRLNKMYTTQEPGFAGFLRVN